MRRILFLLLLAVAAVVARRLLSGRRRWEEPLAAPADDFDPAVELRRKLADTRAADPATAETAVADPDERRREVHEEGREAVEHMRASDPAE